MQYPTLSGSTVRHIELVALAPTRLLAVLILSTGRVEQRIVDLGDEAVADDDALVEVRTQVQRVAVGERIHEAAVALGALVDDVSPGRRPLVRRIADTLVEAMSDHRSDERVVVGGTANLTRFGDAFDTSLKPLLEALEEHVVLLKLLGEAGTSPTVTVRIGHEGPLQELSATSVVASGYGPGSDALAALGHRGTDPHGLPRNHGRRTRRRALRLGHSRRDLTTKVGMSWTPTRSSASTARPTPTRSRRRIGGLPGSTTRT